MALNMRTPAIALLATLAVAGFQNREQLGRMLGDVLGNKQPGDRPDRGGEALGARSAGSNPLGDMLGGLGGMLGGGTAGGTLKDGLGDLLDRFRQTGHADEAESWVKDRPNRQIDPTSVEEALGPDVLEQLQTRTGLDRSELLRRLSTNLPAAVDTLTPEGRLPTEQEANGFSRYRTQ